MNTVTQVRVPFVDLKAQYASIKQEVADAIHSVLESGHFVGGEWVEKFEQEFAQYAGAQYAVGVGSGTAALELALRAKGIGAGDEVIVPANTFFATAEAVTNVGAKPVFADVDPVTFHLSPAAVNLQVTPKTRAIIPVHLYGRAADLTELEKLASLYELEIIEDACQAHGVERDGTRVGGSGHLTCFSFYPGKNLGAYGDGGAITCNDPETARMLRMLRDHGSPRKYDHVLVGTNSRLDAIQAAILSVKLPHLDDWNALRRRHARRLASGLGTNGIFPPALPPEGQHNFHLFVVRSRRRDDLKAFLQERGIDTGIHYPVPLHLTPAYQKLGYTQRGTLPVAEMLASEILSLPMYPELADEQIGWVIAATREFCQGEAAEDAASAVPA
jgi:dTDP-4-amino-4,6-dideoxygalactose transaminase